MVFTVALALATVAMAADPMLGTWTLNVAKSTFAPGAATPKEATAVFRELDANTFECVATGTRTDGSQIAARYTWPIPGGVRRYSQGAAAEGLSIVEIGIDAQLAYTIALQDGRQLRVTHWVISKDGKTMAGTTTGVDAKGAPQNTHILWEKQ
jgi:hypothetical protein